MKHFHIMLVFSILASAFAGCGPKPAPANRGVTGKNVVVILTTGKRFKDEVVARVTTALEKKGIRVLRDARGASGAYRAADYGAVVYFAERWMWHTPFHAQRYFRRNGNARNIVFVITSGDPDVKIRKPFDAVTSASSPKEVDRVTNDVFARLELILGK